MPELPEVENVRRMLIGLSGHSIVAVSVPEPHRFLIDLPRAAGCRIVSLRRRGKVLLFDLEPPEGHPDQGRRLELVVHLGMTGRLLLEPAGSAAAATHLRAELVVDDGTVLRFCDTRRFGRILVCTPGVYPTLPMLERIAQDPDHITLDVFEGALRRSTAPVKARLLDQRVVAGVGNIYADEALWRSGIHPEAPSDSLTSAQVSSLLDSLNAVLAESIESGGTTFRDYRRADGTVGRFQDRLQVYSRAGMACTRCATTLRSTKVAGRTSVFCPTCQTA